MNPRSIKFRLVAWYAGLLTVIFLLLCALLYLDLQNFLETTARDTQARRVRQLCDRLLTQVKQMGEPYVVSQIKDWYAPESTYRFIRITRGDGTLVYVSGVPKDGSFDPDEIGEPGPLDGGVTMRKQRLSTGNTMIIATTDFKSAGNPDYVVEFGALLTPAETMLNHLFLQLAMGLPLAIAIITIGGYLLVHRALRPVEQITRTAERITQLNLSERLPATGSDDELEQLSQALNRMIARLDDAFQNSKRFAADASHDLRTPLTILRGELESLVEDPELEERSRERLAGLLEEAIHLSRIVEQLFTLTRLDSGEPRKDWIAFDLAELAQTTADQMSLLAEDKRIALTCEAGGPVPVQGDCSRIKQVIVNLLDNAIKYTPAAGRVQVRVHAQDGLAILEVQDSGIGIPPEALPHVFERFYRVDKARCADAKSAGLGLSIVKAICALHAGEVEAISTPGVGSRFTVKLPLQKSEKASLTHELQNIKANLL